MITPLKQQEHDAEIKLFSQSLGTLTRVYS